MEIEFSFRAMYLVLIFFACSSNSCTDLNRFPEIMETTVLVYICDGTPDSYRNVVIKELQKIGSNESVNVLVYSSCALDQSREKAFVVGKEGIFREWEGAGRVDSWVQCTIDACKWAHFEYPSRYFVLVFCAPSLGEPLDEVQVSEIVSSVCAFRGKIDLVAFDADMMASMEAVCALAPYAHYLVASAGCKVGDWFPYDAMLKYASKQVLFSTCKMAFDMVNAYEDRYETTRYDYTLSAIDLSKGSILLAKIDEMVFSIHELLNLNDGILGQMIIESSLGCAFFEHINRRDLGQFLANLQEQIARAKISDKSKFSQLRKNIAAAKRAANGCVIQSAFGARFANSTGLTFLVNSML